MKFKRASFCIKIVILAMLVYGSISLISARERTAMAETDRAALQAQVDALLRENAELEYDIAHAGDPTVIAEIARNKLGLVMPGEKILYDVGN